MYCSIGNMLDQAWKVDPQEPNEVQKDHIQGVVLVSGQSWVYV